MKKLRTAAQDVLEIVRADPDEAEPGWEEALRFDDRKALRGVKRLRVRPKASVRVLSFSPDQRFLACANVRACAGGIGHVRALRRFAACFWVLQVVLPTSVKRFRISFPRFRSVFRG